MKKFISIQEVRAEEMTYHEFCEKFNQVPNADYDNIDGYVVCGENDQISFINKEEFDHYCVPVTNLTFGAVVNLAKQGKRIARTGWNGKGMEVAYNEGYPEGIPCSSRTAKVWGIEAGKEFKLEPYLTIKMANGSHAMWVPSLNDCLATDWYVVDDEQ